MHEPNPEPTSAQAERDLSVSLAQLRDALNRATPEDARVQRMEPPPLPEGVPSDAEVWLAEAILRRRFPDIRFEGTAEPVPEPPASHVRTGGGSIVKYALPGGGVVTVARVAGRMTVEVRDADARQVLQVSAPDPRQRDRGSRVR